MWNLEHGKNYFQQMNDVGLLGRLFLPNFIICVTGVLTMSSNTLTKRCARVKITKEEFVAFNQKPTWFVIKPMISIKSQDDDYWGSLYNFIVNSDPSLDKINQGVIGLNATYVGNSMSDEDSKNVSHLEFEFIHIKGVEGMYAEIRIVDSEGFDEKDVSERNNSHLESIMFELGFTSLKEPMLFFYE